MSTGTSRSVSTESWARQSSSAGARGGGPTPPSPQEHRPAWEGGHAEFGPAWAGQVQQKLFALEAENTMLRERLDALEDAFLHSREDGGAGETGGMAAVGTAKEKTVRRKLHLRALGMLQKGWPLNSTYDPTVTRRLIGHSDGIWDVVCKPWHGGTIVGTASADQTARIWYDGACVCIYQGHAGSVNAISAGSQSSHGMPLMCTGSGDGTARLWRLPDGCLPHQTEEDVFHDALPPSGYSGGGQSGPIEPEVPIVRDDLQLFRGHTGVVSAIECFGQGRDKVVTGSWDRTGRVWDLESGSLFQVLKGHDAELTHVSSHPSKPLILTSSRDASFRIWDIRHTSNELVFQGHGDSVTSALFTDANGIVSSSDDRTVKFWDMRNMHSPTIVIRQNAGANRMAISPNGNTVAVPLDNRYVQLYRLTGHRMCRFARNEGHQKMVSAVAWADDQQLISSSFDSQALEWRIIDP